MAENQDQEPANSKYLAGIAADMGRDSAVAEEEPKPTPKPKDEPKPEGKGPDRGEDGKFVKKTEDADAPEEGADDEIEIEDDETTPAAPVPDKKVERLGYEIANLTKIVNNLVAKIEGQGGKPTPAQAKQLEAVTEEIDILKDRDEFQELTTKDGQAILARLKKAEARAEAAESKAERVEAAREADRWYFEKAAETGLKRAELEGCINRAWAKVREQYPNTPDDQLEIAADQLANLLISAKAKALKKPAADAENVPDPDKKPSPKPSTSTQGAKVTASNGASRPQDTRPKSDEERLSEYRKGIMEDFGG